MSAIVITKAELAQLTGTCDYGNGDLVSPLDPLGVACSMLHAAAEELHVLSHAVNDGNVPADLLQNVLWRLSERMGATADIAWANQRSANEKTNGEQANDAEHVNGSAES